MEGGRPRETKHASEMRIMDDTHTQQKLTHTEKEQHNESLGVGNSELQHSDRIHQPMFGRTANVQQRGEGGLIHLDRILLRVENRKQRVERFAQAAHQVGAGDGRVGAQHCGMG